MKCGLHLHQFPALNEDTLKRLRIPIWTALDMDMGYYARFDDGKAEWIIRIYSADVMASPPDQWADRTHHTLLQWLQRQGGDPKRFIAQGYNELNLGIEHANSGEPWDTDAKFAERLKWMLAYHRQLKGYNPPYQIGGCWDSPGHQDVDLRQEIRLYAEAGLYDLIDVLGYHGYAEGLDFVGPTGRAGYDREEWWLTHNRPVLVRQVLNETGYGHLPIYIGETNRKDVTQGDILGELERWSDRIAPYLRSMDGKEGAWTFFVWSSGDPGFGSMRLGLLANDPGFAPRFQVLIDRHLSTTPLPPPPVPPPVVPPPPSGGQVAAIAAKYNLTLSPTPTMGIALQEAPAGQMELRAEGPADAIVRIRTLDGQHNVFGSGSAAVIMAASSFYDPAIGQGPWKAECEGAEVIGLGWFGNHEHPNVRFVRLASPPPEPPPVEPPTPPPTGYTWHGAFADYAMAHPEVGQPTNDIHYLPPDWVTAVQISVSHLLIWNGSAVTVVER